MYEIVQNVSLEGPAPQSKKLPFWPSDFAVSAVWVKIIEKMYEIVLNMFPGREGYCNTPYDRNSPKPKCDTVRYNDTHSTASILCRICDIHVYNLTICYTNIKNKITADLILRLLPVNETKDLTLEIDNTWKGHFPLQFEPIDLRNIGRLVNLKIFQMHIRYFIYSEPFPLLFNKSTFAPLSQLLNLTIHIPLYDITLKDIVDPLTSLNVLDLSYVRGLSLENLKDTLTAIKGKKIKYLCLRSFQLIGGDGYSPNLNISELQNLINDSCLENLVEIDLSDNSFARISPGISNFAPNLRKWDISGNILLDSHNVPIIIESILHPHLIEFNVGYQGWIGGGIRKETKHSKRNDYNTEQSVDFIAQPEINSDNDISFLRLNSFIIHCINIVSNGNVINIFNDKESVCKILQCIMPVQFGGIPCHVFPRINDIIDLDCN